MRRGFFLHMPIILSFLLAAFSDPVAAGNHIEVFKHGRIDWTNGFIEAVGVGNPPPNPLSIAHARAVAQRNAEVAARANLIELVKSIRLDSKSFVANHIEEGRIRIRDLEAVLREARVVDLIYGQGEAVKVAVSISMLGAVSELILPKGILIISTVKQPKGGDQKDDPFSGLLVDCTGVYLKPCMVPVIVDEGGEAVYGPAFTSRDYAVQRGMASYMGDLAMAKSHSRLGGRPLIVKGIRSMEGDPCDIMISHADAAKIRGAPSNLNFLHQCRVMLVVD